MVCRINRVGGGAIGGERVSRGDWGLVRGRLGIDGVMGHRWVKRDMGTNGAGGVIGARHCRHWGCYQQGLQWMMGDTRGWVMWGYWEWKSGGH